MERTAFVRLIAAALCISALSSCAARDTRAGLTLETGSGGTTVSPSVYTRVGGLTVGVRG